MKRDGFDLTATWSGSMEEADERDENAWFAATPVERMEALEHLRAINYGYASEDQPRPEFQRVYRSVELKRSSVSADRRVRG